MYTVGSDRLKDTRDDFLTFQMLDDSIDGLRDFAVMLQGETRPVHGRHILAIVGPANNHGEGPFARPLHVIPHYVRSSPRSRTQS